MFSFSLSNETHPAVQPCVGWCERSILLGYVLNVEMNAFAHGWNAGWGFTGLLVTDYIRTNVLSHLILLLQNVTTVMTSLVIGIDICCALSFQRVCFCDKSFIFLPRRGMAGNFTST